MNLETVRNYCLGLEGTTEGFPFDDETLVFKIQNKMYCLMNMTPPWSINLKCDPEIALELREEYPAVSPGYHMNKKHWNTVTLDGSIKDEVVCKWIKNSYELVLKSLPRKQREKLRE